MGPIGYNETSIRNYKYSLRNNPEERSSHFSALPTPDDLYQSHSTSLFNALSRTAPFLISLSCNACCSFNTVQQTIQSATVDNGVGTGRVMNLWWKEAPYYLRCCLTVMIRTRRREECNKGWLRGRLGTASWSKTVHVANCWEWNGLGWTGLGMGQRSVCPGGARRGHGYSLYCRTPHTSDTEKLRVAHLLPYPLWSPKCHYRAPSWTGRIRPASH